MSLPVRSCLCRRHSEHFGGPLGPRQWLRLLRRSTCSKRGSVRTVFFFSSIDSFFFWWWFFSLPHSRLNSVEKTPDQRRHAWSVSSEHPGTCTTVRSNFCFVCYRSVSNFFNTHRSFHYDIIIIFFLIKHSTRGTMMSRRLNCSRSRSSFR